MKDSRFSRAHLSARMPTVVGSIALSTLFLVMGFWSISTRLSGAIVAPGQIMIEDSRQVVQHLEGGIVNRIFVRNGDTVRTGQSLVELDDTQLVAELRETKAQLFELAAREARYEAELAGQEQPLISAAQKVSRLTHPDLDRQIGIQRSLYAERRENRELEKKSNLVRIALLKTQIDGIEAQKTAAKLPAEIVEGELEAQNRLLDQGLTQSIRVTELARERARHVGDVGRLSANVAHLESEIEILASENARLASTVRDEALSALQDIRPRRVSLEQRTVILQERLGRTRIVAPVDGVIHATTLFGQNSVIQPAQELMQIVPNDRKLVVTASVSSADADQVFVGQHATLRFTSLDAKMTPEVTGLITHVSAEAIEHNTSGQFYFEIEISPNEIEIDELHAQELRPGMPVEVFAKTADRTPLSYVTKPFADYFARAWRDS